MDNMGDREGRAARMAARVENVVLEDADVDADSSSGNESLEEVVRAPLGRARPPAIVASSAMDPGMWINMVNVKPPYWKWIQQFVLEEHFEIICTEYD